MEPPESFIHSFWFENDEITNVFGKGFKNNDKKKNIRLVYTLDGRVVCVGGGLQKGREKCAQACRWHGLVRWSWSAAEQHRRATTSDVMPDILAATHGGRFAATTPKNFNEMTTKTARIFQFAH